MLSIPSVSWTISPLSPRLRVPRGATLPVRAVFKAPMTTVVKPKTDLVVPSAIQRQAGIKTGDRLQFKVSHRTIVITAISPQTYKPTKAELTAIRKGEAAIARGDYVSLTDFLDEMDRPHRKTGAKAARKVSR